MLNYVQITGQYTGADQSPATGTVVFTPNTTCYAPGIPELSPGTPITAQIVAGSLRSASGGTLSLLATDNTLNFTGRTGYLSYQVQETVNGVVFDAWSFTLPYSKYGAGPVDINSLANTTAGSTGIVPPAGDIGGTSSSPTVVSTHLASPLPVAQGGTAAATAAAGLANLGGAAVAGDIGGTSAAPQVTGTHLSAPLPVAQGGTGQTAQQAAINALTGTQSAGKYLRSDGANASLAAIQAGDVPALPYDASGAASAAQAAAEAASVPATAYLPLLFGAVWKYAWQFLPEPYGGKADGVLVSDGAMTSGQATLACTSSAPFTSTAVDGGKPVMVMGAGAGGGPLLTTISTVTDSAHAVLAAAASVTVTPAGVIFGSDNTAAVKSMQAAGVAYAQGGYGRQEAEFLLTPELRVVAGAATVGGATLGNAIFPRPVIAGSAPKLSLTWRCMDPVDVCALPHWLQTAPQAQGATIAVLRLDGTLDATYGPASVFGGPLHGYGGAEGGVFNNMQTVVDGISLLVPPNSTFGGWDFYGDAECLVRSGAAYTMQVVPSGQAWPQFSPSAISNQWSYALRMPSQGNNARADVGGWSAYGFTYGFMPCEHTRADSVRCDYNITGIEGYASGTHGGLIRYASCERNINGLGFRDGICHLSIDVLDVESNTATIYDPQSFGNGTIGIRGLGQSYVTGVANGGLALKQVNLDMVPGPVVSPQAPPGTGSAWFNGYYRDAEITLQVSAGTLTAVSITGAGNTVAQAVPASATWYRFLLGAGQSYTPVFTGGVGSLTHTVTLF